MSRKGGSSPPASTMASRQGSEQQAERLALISPLGGQGEHLVHAGPDQRVDGRAFIGNTQASIRVQAEVVAGHCCSFRKRLSGSGPSLTFLTFNGSGPADEPQAS